MIGAELGERYRVLRRLGEGGMGEVYLAEHLQLGRKEAIKVLLPGAATRPQFVSRFRREARATNRVHHPNIVSVYDFGRLADGRLFLAMEYAEGERVDTLVRKLGRLPLKRVLPVLSQLIGAVGHAHSCGVIHRDLKPANLILVEHRGQSDVLKVLDFGLSKIIAEGHQESFAVTGRGDVLGTPGYMAPEVVRGILDDPRSDLYAVGCIAFELLTGTPPFVGAPLEVLAGHTREPIPRAIERAPHAQLPVEVDEWIARCLAKEPAERFQTAAEVGEALQAVPGFASAIKGGRAALRRTALGVKVQRSDFAEPDETDAAATHEHEFSNVHAPTLTSAHELLDASVARGLLALADALLDAGVADVQLTLLDADLCFLEDEIVRTRSKQDALGVREAEIEQAQREREGTLRFALSDLRFHRESLGPADKEKRADLDLQIRTLEARLRELTVDTERKLAEITEHGIAMAAALAKQEDHRRELLRALGSLVGSYLGPHRTSPTFRPLIEELSRVGGGRYLDE